MITTLWFASLLAFSAGVDDRWVQLLKEANDLADHSQLRQAAMVYSAALEEAKRLGPDELPAALVLNNSGYNCQQLGEVRDAARRFSEALAIYEREYPAGEHRVAEVAMNLSSAYIASNEISKAESLLRRFLRNGTKLQDQDRAAVMEDLGTVLERQGNWEEADQRYRESLAVFERQGDDQERILIGLSNLSALSSQRHRFSEAIQYSDRAVALLGTIKRPSPTVAVKTLTNAAVLAAMVGQREKAEADFRQAVNLCEESFGPDHYLLGHILRSYSFFLSRAHRASEARRIANRAKAILDRFAQGNEIGLTIDAKALMNAVAR